MSLMITWLLSQLHVSRRGLFSLALLPAFLYGTLPHTACICADGHREEHCRVLSRRESAAKFGAKTHCSCCQVRQGERSCCQTNKHPSKPQSGLIFAGTCCQPIVESPAPLAPSAKVQSPNKSALLTALAPTVEYWSAVSSRITPGHPLSTQPPLDVVIVYLHLTI